MHQGGSLRQNFSGGVSPPQRTNQMWKHSFHLFQIRKIAALKATGSFLAARVSVFRHKVGRGLPGRRRPVCRPLLAVDNLKQPRANLTHCKTLSAIMPAVKNPEFYYKIGIMQLELSAIYPLPAGPPHPRFPKTILHFWLLNEAEINDMARYYSQSEPDQYTLMYPHPMNWDEQAFKRMDDFTRLFLKRRELGLFIGLRVDIG